ncbi:MAG: hypothetical protein V7717_00230 [Porticoccaceae bacterium]
MSAEVEWTQGSYFKFSHLSEETKAQFKEGIPGQGRIRGTSLIVVISQDCDIQASSGVEFYVQLMVAERVNSTPPLNYHARSSRFLALDIGGAIFKLKALKICFFPKEAFFECKESSQNRGEFDFEQKELLRRWLAQRYNRAALPDSFNRRISGVIDLLPNQKVDLYLRLDSEVENEDCYAVAIIAVPYKGANIDAKGQVELFKDMELLEIAINNQGGLTFDRDWLDEKYYTLVMTRSDTPLEVLDEFKRWNLDYISYKDDDYGVGQNED